MTITDAASARLALDPAIGSDLRVKLAQDPQGGLKQAAKQFEGLLLSMMLKSMREATPGNGLLDNQQSQFFTTLGDQQLAMQLASQSPLGFAAMIEKQLGRQMASGAAMGTATPPESLSRAARLPAAGAQEWRSLPAASFKRSGSGANVEAAGMAEAMPVAGRLSEKVRSFVDRVWPHAVDAAAATGIPARFLVAHSALESGWGKAEIKDANGASSFNLFGIKAGRSWSGPTVEVQTTEFINGVAQSVRARFRAYASYAEAFRDYASLLASKPRFAAVIGQQDGTQFARSLQQAGYATDPMYADKLARIINGPLLQQALAS